MLNQNFSPRSPFISVKQYLIKGTFFILPLIFILHSPSLGGNKYEITNNFSNNETLQPPDDNNYQFGEQDLFLYGDFNYHANIGAVKFHPIDWEMGPPIIRMKSPERLILQFDDLDADYKNYSYTIIHCDAHWEPTPLSDFEYIDGFNQDQINNYSYSMNTIVPFTHYWLEFPNPDMRPMLSGNYLLVVFSGGDINNVAFTRRFMVFDQRLPVSGTAHFPEMVIHRDMRHQLAFTIDMTPYHISNPYRDLRVVIRQNDRWDNAITDISPRMIRGNQLIYDHEDQLLFNGGNEFRRFDLRSLRQVSERVEDITTGARYWNIFLLADQPRPYRRYTFEEDINGRFSIQTADAADNDLEADYAWVNFRLKMPEPVEQGSVHIMGELTQWAFSSQSEMTYNYRLRQYEARMLLKQGFYNYWYAFVDESQAVADVCPLEGCHSQTENEYTVLVYHRPPGSVHDHLVGMANFNSSIIKQR